MKAWMKLLPAKEIIVIDNKVAKDEFMITVLEMAAPTGVKVKVFPRSVTIANGLLHSMA